jgi:chromosome partitioning protein
MGLPVYETGDRRGKIAWSDYQKVGKEIVKWVRQIYLKN